MNATMTLDVLLIDDEPLARKRLRQFLGEYDDCTIVGECGDGREAIARIRELTPDLVFLDVQMPEVNGLDVLAALDPGERPLVVFVTAHDAFAVRAFEVHAVDYLLKPFDRDRFRGAYERARELFANRAAREQHTRLSALLAETGRVDGGLDGPPPILRDRILVKTGTRVLFLNPSDIDWVEAAGNYVRLHVGADEYIVRESITRLESMLGPGQFARVHRSTIVNLNRVRELRPWFSGEMIIVMHSGAELKLSRTYRKDLERRVHILS
ncbi:MAG: LytR/AlgR family response regulator transcription factor [Longimicrobiales bacterium]